MQEIRACRVAIVGAGAMALEHVRAFSSLSGVEILAIFNRNFTKAENLAKQHRIPHVFDDLDEMLATIEPDIVVMAIYETGILETATNILCYPTTLFMEKPIGINLATSIELARRADAADRQVFVGLNRRFLSSTVAAKSDLDTIPDARFIEISDQQDLVAAKRYGHDQKVVDNWMYANSIHLVDYLSTFGRGPLSRVEVVVPWRAENPSTVLGLIHFESGDMGLYRAIWDGPGPWSCTISTPTRRWEMRPLEYAKFQNRGERILHEVEMSDDDKAFKPGFRLQAEQVIRAWRGQTNSAATLAMAMASTKLVAQLYGLAKE